MRVGELRSISDDLPQGMRKADVIAWLIEEWDEPGDNIFVWDFWELETKGGLYLRDEYAVGPSDSHPTSDFAQEVAPMFAQRIVDVLEGRGDSGSLTGR
jgi:hypothetical protein